MPTPAPVRPEVILVICFSVAIVLPVVHFAIIPLRLSQADVAYRKALLSQPLFLGILVVGACIAALIASPIIWRLGLESCWFIDGVLLAAFLLASSRTVFRCYFHAFYLPFSIRDLIFCVWATVTVPLFWLTLR